MSYISVFILTKVSYDSSLQSIAVFCIMQANMAKAWE